MASYDELEPRVREVENKFISLETEHHSVMSDLYGNGQPGLRDTVKDFITEIRTRDATVKSSLEDYHDAMERRDRRRNLIIGGIGLLIVILQWVKH